MFRQLRQIFALFLVFWVLPRTQLAQSNPYENDIRAFEQADLRNPPPTNSILFVGSSSIVRWDSLARAFPAYNVLNRGFGGSQASDVLYFYDRIVLPYHPPLIVFYEGDNDLAGGLSVDTVFAAWTNFVGRVERDLPETHILFVAVKPSPSRQQFLPQQKALNDRVREFNAQDPKLHFADVFTALLDDAGKPRADLVVSDQLHLNAAGYAIWESVIVPEVDDWANRYPIEVRKPQSNGLLIDLGGEDSLSGVDASAPVHWNNVTTTFASSSSAVLSNLVTVQGAASALAVRMLSRFNGANENGTTAASIYPPSATRDSLFGNTETFSGQANIFPAFELTGLAPGPYRISFYASRLGVSDNRETRYTLTGSGTNTVDLNAANNVEAIAVATAIEPSEAGTLKIALTPGPNNNNANHFTYLGALHVESLNSPDAAWLFDFGSTTSLTETESSAAALFWNNLTLKDATNTSGRIENLVATNGLSTSVALSIISPFNGVNQNGTSASTNFPSSATTDSLYGNRELFNGLENVTPRFQLSGLPPNATLRLTFFASRLGVADNRETRYTVTGQDSISVTLDAANNTNAVAILDNVFSTADGGLTVELTAGPNNNNANHFTYLGVLGVNWTIPPFSPPALLQPSLNADGFSLLLRGESGATYDIETSSDARNWIKIRSIRLDKPSEQLQFEPTVGSLFYRAIIQAITR